jgi:hypothetical protein
LSIRRWRKSAFTVSEADLSCFGPMIGEYLDLDLEKKRSKNTEKSLIHRRTICISISLFGHLYTATSCDDQKEIKMHHNLKMLVVQSESELARRSWRYQRFNRRSADLIACVFAQPQNEKFKDAR